MPLGSYLLGRTLWEKIGIPDILSPFLKKHKVDLVFYNLTSTYFTLRESKGNLKCHGHSRDEKKRNVQVVVGIVSEENIKFLEFLSYRYILGHPRRSSKKTGKYFESPNFKVMLPNLHGFIEVQSNIFLSPRPRLLSTLWIWT